VPCLFNLADEINETTDLSRELPQTTLDMWRELNYTWLSGYTSWSPASLLGPCNETCAAAKWVSIGGLLSEGPFCDVPGCEPADNNSDVVREVHLAATTSEVNQVGTEPESTPLRGWVVSAREALGRLLPNIVLE
jgi:hypothetical protein